jgi:hypothetical protein
VVLNIEEDLGEVTLEAAVLGFKLRNKFQFSHRGVIIFSFFAMLWTTQRKVDIFPCISVKGSIDEQ